jgi:hypothetical protein
MAERKALDAADEATGSHASFRWQVLSELGPTA